MAGQTNTIRIPSRTYARLRRVAEAAGKPMSTVIDEAIDTYETEGFFRDLDSAFRELRRRPAAWTDEKADRRLFERTLLDGLEGS